MDEEGSARAYERLIRKEEDRQPLVPVREQKQE
jgi:hypothetical protein